MAVIDKQLGDSLMTQLPRSGWRKTFFKTPLYFWRMGFSSIMPPQFACITTRGSKSGLPRHTMVECSAIGDDFYVISGWQDKAHWVKNLLVDSHVTIHPVRHSPVAGNARRVDDDATLHKVFEAMQVSPMLKPWLASQGIAPDVSDFLANKERLYIFQITPEGEIELPPMAQDLRWMPLMVFAGAMIFLRLASRLRRSASRPRILGTHRVRPFALPGLALRAFFAGSG